LLDGSRQQDGPNKVWYRFSLPLEGQGQPQVPGQAARETDLAFQGVDRLLGVATRQASLEQAEAAVVSVLSSYQPLGCVMAVCAAVRHRWQRLPDGEQLLLLHSMRQLTCLRAGAPELVAVALSAGGLPSLGGAAGLDRRQVEAAFGSKVAWLLVELQQLAAIERTIRASSVSSGTGMLSQGQVDLAMSLMTAPTSQRTSESLILFLAHKAAELWLASRTGSSSEPSPDTSLLLSAAMGTEVFAALANLLGLGRIKDELEDAAFAITHAKERTELQALLGGPEGEALVTGAAEELQDALEGSSREQLAGLSSLRVSGRAKSAFSTWRKMRKKSLRFEQVWDRAAIRVILDAPAGGRAEELCFAVRDIVVGLWSPVAGREKDYVRNPKPNGYRSLHLVAERNGQPFEVQIRTEEMHRQAEYGSAGHWEYKAGGKGVSMSRAAEEAAAELFAGIDADGDGSIGPEELQVALRRVGVEATMEEAQAMLEVFDADSDGSVDFREFWRALLTTWFPLVSGTHRPRRRSG